MSNVSLVLKLEDGTVAETLAASFDDADLSLFASFVRKMSRVRTCALLTRGMPAITNMSFTAEAGMVWTCPPYENAELHELLHVLRPVILQEEPTSFQNISGLLRRKFASRRFSDHLRPIRAMFEDGELKGYMQITIGRQPLLDKSLLHLWLNAEQYHTDAEKAERWAELERSLTTENARALIMTQLQSKVKALFHLEYIVSLVREKAANA